MSTLTVTRVRVRVAGIVQGVGFRPFVHALAGELALSGFVGNDDAGVVVEVEGAPEAVEAFVAALRERPPALAVVESVATSPVAPTGERGFAIAPSTSGGTRDALVSPDTATCDDCLAEMADPADRRFRYPFVNCTNCGPRYTIVRDVPYDRARTTMATFTWCADCAAEYHDPRDRRYHAQPVCCPACGPSLLLDGSADDPLRAAARRLAAGEILAVKGLGGYHLAVRADDERDVARLRAAKHREDKPFAVMAADLAAARALVDVDDAGADALRSRRRPVVLLPRHPGSDLARSVAPGNRHLGVMLPYTPLHHLLAAELGVPFVLTSGNSSDEPIAYRDEDARQRLAGIADGFLTHDRAIHMRTDDSVVRLDRGRELPIRRARGYAPEPVPLPFGVPRPVLACGGELKNTFCLARGRRAFLSSHVGDLENYETLRSFVEGIEHLGRLFDVWPAVVAHDLHPEYLSTKYALDRDDVDLVGVQHHHAHIASCLADNGCDDADGPVLGVAYDGTGYGPDGTIWGGELLLADRHDYRRVGHLDAVALPGGAAAVRQPWRMAAAHLDAAGLPTEGLDVVARHGRDWDAVVSLSRAGHGPSTSSAGRLFDAVAALVGVRDAVTYEGQAAAELEQRVDPDERGSYPAGAHDGVLRVGDLVGGVLADLRAGVAVGRIAARFHHGLADATVRAVVARAEEHGVGTAALSGGVFVNRVLLERTRDGLETAGLRVLVHSRVPCNDGGLSLGQVAVAAARDSRRGNPGKVVLP